MSDKVDREGSDDLSDKVDREGSDDLSDKVDRDKLAVYLQEKELTKRCPLCGREGLMLIGDLLYGLPLRHIRMDDGESNMPIVPIICSYCGNTLLINATTQNLLAGQGDE